MSSVYKRGLLFSTVAAAVLLVSTSATASACTASIELRLDRVVVMAYAFDVKRFDVAVPAIAGLAKVDAGIDRDAAAGELAAVELGKQDKAEAFAIRPTELLFSQAGQAFARWGRFRGS